jgi:hypothetical protein
VAASPLAVNASAAQKSSSSTRLKALRESPARRPASYGTAAHGAPKRSLPIERAFACDGRPGRKSAVLPAEMRP